LKKVLSFRAQICYFTI